MDAFYASVEQRDNPSLRGQPVIVGGSPEGRGVVCAASYEARKFGVRSAMPTRTAARLCPRAAFVHPRMDQYRSESKQIMALVRESVSIIEQVSVDEAYLDMSSSYTNMPAEQAIDRAGQWAESLRQRICSERQLTASIGVAPNKLLAKLGSDYRKPDGLTLVYEHNKVAFLRPLPVGAIHGVGKVTQATLERAGFRSIADIQDHPGDLREMLGSFGPRLKQFAVGEDDREVYQEDDVKSVSSETTFREDTDERKLLRACLKEQAMDIERRLTKRRLCAYTVHVKVRYSDFSTLTRQLTVQDGLTQAGEIYRLACVILAKERLVSRPLRLLGLGVSQLSDATCQQLRLSL